MRVTILADNPEQIAAECANIEKVREDLKDALDSAESKEAMIQSLIDRRKLPKKRLNVFELDPAMNYALRRSEIGYEDGSAVERVDCEDFVQVEGRPLWVVRKCVQRGCGAGSRLGAVDVNAVSTTISTVTELSGKPQPDELFAPKFTEPGTRITDRAVEPGEEHRYLVLDDGSLREEW